MAKGWICSGISGDAGENETSNSVRTKSARRRRSAALRGLIAGLLALAAVVSSFPAPAQTTEITLVSNIHLSTSFPVARLGHDTFAQGFLTGANPHGYTLTKVRIVVTSQSNTTAPTVRINPRRESNIGGTTLQAPSMPANRDGITLSYESSSGVPLEPSTRYYVKVRSYSEDQDVAPQLAMVRQDAYRAQSGWRLNPEANVGNKANSNTFLEQLGRSLKIEVLGFANTVAPGVPTDLSATAHGRRIDLSWTAPSEDGGEAIEGYKIEVSTDGGNSFRVLDQDTNSTDTDYSHTGLGPGQTRHYQVSAVNSVGTGDPSNIASARTAANGAPTASDGSVMTNEDTAHTFTAAQFDYSDPERDALSSVKIVTLPADGSLTLNGTNVSAGDSVSKTNIDANRLKYTPPANANGMGYASFTFRVNDGFNESASANTMTIHVRQVNDPAAGKPTIAGTARVGNEITSDVTGVTDVDGLPSVFTYHWKRYAADGLTFEANVGANANTYVLTPAEDGKKVKVEVSFTDGDGNSEGPLAGDVWPADGTVQPRPVGSNTAPVFSDATTTRAIAETVGATTVTSAENVGAPVTASDSDGENPIYTLEGADAGRFDIVTASGQIRTKVGESYDHEAKASYAVVVRASDGRGGSNTIAVTISVTDASEPPLAPGRPTVEASGATSLSVSWSAPDNAGRPAITGYKVQHRQGTSGSWTDVAHSGTVTSATVTVADSGAVHEAQVLATNTDGDGPWSLPGNSAVPATETGPPGPPRNLRGAGGEERVTLVWDTPASRGGSPIVRYEYDVDGSGVWTSAGAALTATATGLVNGQAYAFRVRAVNARGPGPTARVTAVAGRLDRIARWWLARFTREASAHVSSAIEERLRGAPSGVVFGGQNLRLGEKVPASDEPNADAAGTALLLRREPAFPLAGNGSFLGGATTPGRALYLHTGEDLEKPWRELRISEALLASSFHLASAETADAGPRWSVWGRGERSNFEGRDEELGIEGGVTTATLGIDYESGRVLVGVALSRSEGDGTSRMRAACPACEDSAESALTGVYPYASYRMGERLSLWGALGMGRGELRLSPDGGSVSIETDIKTSLAAAGARGVLLPAPRSGGFEIAVRTDLLLVAAGSDKAAGLSEIETNTMRVRLLLEGSRAFRFGGDAVLTPSFEVGVRHDGGDAETGDGLEVGGSLRYAAQRLMVEVSARGLIVHSESDYEELGVSGSVRYATGTDGRGLSMSVGSARGPSSGGAERLWSQAQGGFSGSGFDPETRLDAEVGYGLDAPRRLLTPYAGVAVSANAETWRAGARWKLGPAYEVGLEASLKESGAAAKPESGILLRGSRRW